MEERGDLKGGQRVGVLDRIRRTYISQSQICLMKVSDTNHRCDAKQPFFSALKTAFLVRPSIKIEILRDLFLM